MRRNGKAERLGGPQIYHQLEFGRLFDRKIARASAFENPVYVVSLAPRHVEEPQAVGHQAASEHEFTTRWSNNDLFAALHESAYGRRHPDRVGECPLSGVKRTLTNRCSSTSIYDEYTP